MSRVVKGQAFIVRRVARRVGLVRLLRVCTLTCKPHTGVCSIHVDVQPLAQPSLCRHPHRHALHVDVQSVSAPVVACLHVDVQTNNPPSPALPRSIVLHVDVQHPGPSLRRHYCQRVLHVDVHPFSAHAVGGLHVDVQSPFSLSCKARSDDFGPARKSLHVNLQRLRDKRKRWAGDISPRSKQKANRQLRSRQNLGLSHFGVRK